MNIIVQNRRNVEFELADLEVQIKDFVEANSIVVTFPSFLTPSLTLFSTTW